MCLFCAVLVTCQYNSEEHGPSLSLHGTYYSLGYSVLTKIKLKWTCFETCQECGWWVREGGSLKFTRLATVSSMLQQLMLAMLAPTTV